MTGFRTGPPHKSPLHLAAASANTEIMEQLVKRGAAWRDKDDWGWTVLHEAAASGHQKGQCHQSPVSRDVMSLGVRDPVGVQGEQGPDQCPGQARQVSPSGGSDGWSGTGGYH